MSGLLEMACHVVSPGDVLAVHRGATASEFAKLHTSQGAGGPGYSWMTCPKGVEFRVPTETIVPWKDIHAVVVAGVTDEAAADLALACEAYVEVATAGDWKRWGCYRTPNEVRRDEALSEAWGDAHHYMHQATRAVVARGLAALACPDGQLELFGAAS